MIKFFERYSKLSWLITILIAIFIFYISSLTFPPGPATTNISTWVYHFSIFFLLGFFLILSIVKGKNKSFIFLAVVIAIFYAVSDEIHQLFVFGRCCSFLDFLIDSSGVLLASFIYVLSLRFRKKNRYQLSYMYY